MPTTEQVRDRIAGRKWAEEVAAENMTPAFRAGFMNSIKRCFTVREIDPQAMSDEEAREFGRDILGFGQHANETYDDCPLEYLEWLVDQNATLARYLRSRRIQEEREDDADD